MRVELTKKAARQLDQTNEPLKSRIIKALRKLEKEPPEGDIKKFQGLDGYRARIGGYRILFDIEPDVISVYKIAPRGQVYKED
ncbi:MAG: type II toxin-antitoxin system RelE/ParE family toxin [Treponema sp.]|nr:type II toxin-antitoxin system RelE/ParE family toxin [Treponema sp.]